MLRHCLEQAAFQLQITSNRDVRGRAVGPCADPAARSSIGRTFCRISPFTCLKVPLIIVGVTTAVATSLLAILRLSTLYESGEGALRNVVTALYASDTPMTR